MKPQRYRYTTHSSRQQALRRRHFIIAGVGIVSVAAIVAAAVFISGKLLSTAAPEKAPSSSVSDETSAGESSDGKNSEESSDSKTESSKEESKQEDSSAAQITIDPNGPEYQKKYPDLYVTDRKKMHVQDADDKTVYLTFDDGPSDLTAPLLDILKKCNVKATFFNCCQSDYQETFAPLMKRAVDEGHVVAVHSYTHQFREVYASVDDYLDDFYKMYKLIEETTGEKPANFFRFPGGSLNGYNQATYEDIIKEMTRRGFIYYDWDGDSGDASGANVSAETIYKNTMDAIHRDCDVILMHNIFGKENTLSQVERIITEAQAEGYTFEAMDGTLDPTHGYIMTTDVFLSAVEENPLIPLSDWRLEKEQQKNQD